jgi:hypothetical protein
MRNTPGATLYAGQPCRLPAAAIAVNELVFCCGKLLPVHGFRPTIERQILAK